MWITVELMAALRSEAMRGKKEWERVLTGRREFQVWGLPFGPEYT